MSLSNRSIIMTPRCALKASDYQKTIISATKEKRIFQTTKKKRSELLSNEDLLKKNEKRRKLPLKKALEFNMNIYNNVSKSISNLIFQSKLDIIDKKSRNSRNKTYNENKVKMREFSLSFYRNTEVFTNLNRVSLKNVLVKNILLQLKSP